MGTVKINLKYTREPLLETARLKEQISYAMLWLMTATGFSRIFSRADMKEFLFRKAVIMDIFDLFENWMMNDELLSFKLKGRRYLLTVEDLVKNFGMEISDQANNHSSRSHFLNKIKEYTRRAIFIGNQTDCSIIHPMNSSNYTWAISDSESQNIINSDIFPSAEFFTWQLMKNMPESVFTDRSPALLRKEKKLAVRRNRILNLPKFDLTKIPEKIIFKCLRIMTGKDEKYLHDLMNEPVDVENFIRPMIYLAWLWANDFMESNNYEAWVNEGFYLNYDEYELEEGYTNLLETIKQYNIDKTIPLLKGLLINK